MPRIPFPKKKIPRRTALEALGILERTYPNAVTALQFGSEFELLIAVILSAQTTDARVNMSTPALFDKYPTAETLARARQPDVEAIIKSCGFFRVKAKNIIACARDVVERFGGKVPHEREDLESLAGVGRKTASVVMAAAFNAEALAVDTHVFRVAHRLGLTIGATPRQVEEDLTTLLPAQKWGDAAHWLIMHGRRNLQSPYAALRSLPRRKALPHPAHHREALTLRASRSRRRDLRPTAFVAKSNRDRDRFRSA